MKTMIRFALYGCANRPFYHVVAIQQKRARDGKIFEQLGTYDPMPNKDNEKLVAINFERLRYWIARGAEPSQPVQILLGLSGYFPIHPKSYLVARRIKLRAEREAQTESSQSEESQQTQS